MVPNAELQLGQQVLDVILEKSRAATMDFDGDAAPGSMEDLVPLLP
jgi:hypothetical protein